MVIEQVKGLVCDLDGVIYRGDQPIAGAAAAIAAFRESGLAVLFCTNNSRSTVDGYVDRLGGFGIPARPQDILTSAVVTAEVLGAEGRSGQRAIVIGGQGIKNALTEAGIEVEPDPDATRSDLVVVGWDPGFDYVSMRRAATAVRAGATLIATNDDAAFPVPDGLWPGAGAILASIEVASGAPARVMGKPHEPTMQAAARRLGGGAIAIVGDRPETDLAGGYAMGWTTILVLSGVTSAAEAADLKPAPDLVIGSLADLPARLARAG